MTDKSSSYLIPVERIENAIVEIRGQKVMLDVDLAALYGVATRRLKEQVRRNVDRFPADFMFVLTWEEAQALRPRNATSNAALSPRSQIATLKRGRNIKYLPYAFTEHGAVMAAMVLKSSRATEVSVFIVRAFMKMRRMLADQRQFALKLAELESKLAVHDKSFQVVFDALRKLMQPPETKKRRIGFVTTDRIGGTGSDFIARDRPHKRRRASRNA